MSTNLQLITNYQKNRVLRTNYHRLANDIFGLNFEKWYRKGFWTEKYIPFSYVNGEEIVANVSVNKLTIVSNEEQLSAVQIGTVMTHPDYRNRGLATDLLRRVLLDCERNYDLVYLFANRNVLDYYPKFGFIPVVEYQWSLLFDQKTNVEENILKLDGNNPAHVSFLYQVAQKRLPVSQQFGTAHNPELFMFHCMYVFPNDIYYLEKEDAVVIYRQDDEQLHLYDVIAQKEIDLERLLRIISPDRENEIVFHFTPDFTHPRLQKKVYQGSEVLFVKGRGISLLPQEFKYPITSQA